MRDSVCRVGPGEITDLCAQKHTFGALIAFFYTTVGTFLREEALKMLYRFHKCNAPCRRVKAVKFGKDCISVLCGFKGSSDILLCLRLCSLSAFQDGIAGASQQTFPTSHQCCCLPFNQPRQEKMLLEMQVLYNHFNSQHCSAKPSSDRLWGTEWGTGAE